MIITAKVVSINDEVTIKFCVSDTGIGISESGRISLFQRFYQVEHDTKHKFGGTGLGLYISKKLVEAMGGSMSVESEVIIIPLHLIVFINNFSLERDRRLCLQFPSRNL